MPNSFLNHIKIAKLMRKKGAATLVFTVILLVLSTFIILFAANYGRMQEKSLSNVNHQLAAFEAAEAGLEFGINYLKQNSATILASPVAGFIVAYTNASTTNVSMANGSRFTVTYSNPIVNNYTLIQITSVGTNSDGSATRTVTEQVKLSAILVSYGTSALSAKGSINLSGNSTITNTVTNQTITSAGGLSLSGNAHTVTSTGGSTNGSRGPDISANNTALANMSQNDYFASYFGTTSTASIQSKATTVYNASSTTNYNATLNGVTGGLIWINQTNGSTATFTGNTTIGSQANPVILVVNGSLSMSGNVNFYGFIFVIGNTGITTFTGNTTINGGMALSDDLNMSGNISVTYNPTVLDNIINQSSVKNYVKVPGTWKDF